MHYSAVLSPVNSLFCLLQDMAALAVNRKDRSKSPERRSNSVNNDDIKKRDRSRSRSRNKRAKNKKDKNEEEEVQEKVLLSWLERNLPGCPVHRQRGTAASCFYHSMRKHTFDELIRVASSESQKKYPHRLKTVINREAWMVSMTKEQRAALGVAVDAMEQFRLRLLE